VVAKRIVACLDVKDGRVVKGVQFENLRQMGDPVALAKQYSENGADEVVFLDISATVEGRATLVEKVEETAENLFIPLTVGGGIRTVEQARHLLRSGADKLTINTAAIENPRLVSDIAADYGSQCVVVAIDAKKAGNGWTVFSHAGRKDTGRSVLDWARTAEELGAGEILLTSIDADGRQQGYDIALTRAVGDAVRVPVVASGGCGSSHDALRVLDEGNADAALIASLFHMGIETPHSVKEALHAKGVEVRL
jgi:cyclase